MRRLLIVFSLFAICFCLSCFTGLTDAGAHTDAVDSFIQAMQVKYGGTAIAVIPSELPFGAVKVTNIYNGTEEHSQVAQCSDSRHERTLKSVVDAAVRTGYGGESEAYAGGGLNKDPTSPLGGGIVVADGPRAGFSGDDGSGFYSSG